MKLIIKKILAVTCLLGMFLSTVYPVAEARYFGYFSDFWVYRYGNQCSKNCVEWLVCH